MAIRVPADLLADLRHAHASGNPEPLRSTIARWQLRPLDGGRNNHVYTWDDPDRGPSCVKVYRRLDHRRQVEREWAALALLAEHQADHVPRPLWIDRSASQPAIGMTMLEGMPLLEAADFPDALRGLAVTTRRIQAVPLTGPLANLERVDPISHCLHRVTKVWPGQLAERADDPLTARMRSVLKLWEATGDSN